MPREVRIPLTIKRVERYAVQAWRVTGGWLFRMADSYPYY